MRHAYGISPTILGNGLAILLNIYAMLHKYILVSFTKLQRANCCASFPNSHTRHETTTFDDVDKHTHTHRQHRI